MARSIRIQFPEAFYHVMARGNRRESLFLDNDDRRFFLKTLSEACGLLSEGLAAARLAQEEIPALPGSDKRKVAIAAVIWENTTMNLQWLSDRLFLRSAANAGQQLRRFRNAPPPLPKPLTKWIAQSKNVA